ncbi:MAG TPA: carboxypeptidase regulatory-like domain-containing protein, partial [Acidobacteriota bacterium]|nr:carboxypeptidase regulatory-like domain-containing protein [Acidobacteriota bacterium]
MPVRRIFASLLFFLLLAGVTWAQITTGSIRGVVSDSEGKPVPGATVTISSPSLLGGTRTTETNELGVFRFPSLPIGEYFVEATLEGFQKVQVAKVSVRLDATANVPMTMNMATKSEEVNVIGEAPLIDVQQSGLSTNYTKEILESIPTQRSFFDLMQVAPGISQSYGDSVSDRTVAFGSNQQSNSWNIDGLEATAPETGSTWLYQAPDSIQEIQIIGVGAPAEYGNHLGAVFNVVTKKGGNDVHGGASYYFQNKGLTGNNVTLPPCSDSLTPGTACNDTSVGADPNFHRLQYHDFSATIGGPVKKDRLWFFGSAQTLRDNITEPGNDPNNAFPYISDTYDSKVSGLMGQKNEWNAFYHYANWNNGGASPYAAPTALYDERGKDHGWGGGITSTITNNFLLE